MSQIRVLQVIGAMNRAGAETVVMNLMRAMNRERVRFDFLVHTSERCDYDDEIGALGGAIYRLPRYNVVNGKGYRSECRKLLEEHPEIQVVHGHIGSCSAIYLDEARKAGCATIVHSHRDSPKPTSLKAVARRKAYGALTRKTAGIADEFLACGTQAGIDRFGIEVVEGAHFHLMRNGIDSARYACDEDAHKRAKAELGFGDAPLIGCFARLVPEKNHRFLLEAFARALPHIPQAKLLLAGRGPLEGDLHELAKSLGIAESVMFLGVRDDIPQLLKSIDAFALASTVEGLPVIAVEAQAAGVPCIMSTAVPEEAVFTELVQRVELGEGVDEWAARLVALVEADLPRADASSLVRAGGYDIHDVADWMADFYAELARNSERGRRGGVA